MKKIKYNRQYTIKESRDGRSFQYSDGAIESVRLDYLRDPDGELYPEVTVTFRNGDAFTWGKTPACVSSYLYQFGISVSYDGRFVFCQTWDRGMFALDAETGGIIWRTGSRRGITNLFVNSNSLLCCQHEKALQLLNMDTGEVIRELKTTGWGFQSVDSAHIMCRIRANKWCLIESATLEILESFTNREVTGGYADYIVQSIEAADGKLYIHGVRDIWDHSTRPPTKLPPLPLENEIMLKTKK